MAGKRLLDAAKLFQAGRAVGKQHVGLRKEQWDLYTRTSGLAKGVKKQSDRVTVTVAAAIELGKRFSESGPHWEDEARREADIGERNARKEGLDTVQFDDQNSPQDHVTALKTAELDMLSRTRPEQDIDRSGDTLASSPREQRPKPEAQIPALGAAVQSSQHPAAGQDTFNQRPESIALDHSSSPRCVLPEHVENLPAAKNTTIDQDTFPAPDDLPAGLNLNAFHSPRVAQMLGSRRQDIENPYAGRQKLPPQPLPEMIKASQERRQETQAAASHESVDLNPTVKSDIDTQKLAASIAQDATTSESTARPYEMRESKIPATRFGRLWQYGGLATGMAFGAVGESFRRLAGGGSSQGNLMLSEGNMNRLVAKLSRMRGAALKLGQMVSFQDSKVLPPTINAVLQRVQDSADYMPSSQRNKVLVQNLGSDWRDLFSAFEEKPFAAASIGQVHKARLASNGHDVAVKIQYPGVRNSIDSDLNNLSLLLTASQLLPKGLFLDKTIANARTELGWECDYEREAKACIRFKTELLTDEHDTFAVPEVYAEACGPDVLTAELMQGTAVAKIPDLSQHERDWIGTQILRLSLRELMEWRFMQTDPNWTNFLYNRKTRKLELLDFGASRAFPDKFVEPYVSLLIAASKNDRQACQDYSIQLGYLTGHESKDMLQAHVDSILTLAEPFVESAADVYDFEDQTITDRVRSNISLMLRERLAPPPEETYSLHRKLSGAFLLCARLRSQVPAKEMFAQAVQVWNGRARTVSA